MTAFHDRVKETTTSTGSGNITLAGAVAQFQSISSRFAIGERFDYYIVGQTGSEWESGLGYLLDATTLVRERIYESSNADALVVFSAGTKDVFNSMSGNSAASSAGIGLTIAMSQTNYFM